VASLLLAALLLFLFLPRNPGPYRAIPAQSSVVLECTGLLRARILTDKTPDPGWRAVLQDPLFQHCFKDAELVARLFKHDPELLRAFAQNKALAAFSLQPSDELHALFALELDRTIDLEKVLKNSKLATKYIAHQFHGNDLYTVYLSPRELLEVSCSRELNPARNPPKFQAQRTLARKLSLRAGYFCRLCRLPQNRFSALLGVHTLRPGKILPIPFDKTQARFRAGHFGLQTVEG